MISGRSLNLVVYGDRELIIQRSFPCFSGDLHFRSWGMVNKETRIPAGPESTGQNSFSVRDSKNTLTTPKRLAHSSHLVNGTIIFRLLLSVCVEHL